MLFGSQDRSFDRTNAAVSAGGRDAGADIADRYNRFGAAGNLEDRVFGEGQANRGEFRGERGYQNQQAQQTLENRLRQRQLENDEQEAAFRRAYAQQNAGR